MGSNLSAMPKGETILDTLSAIDRGELVLDLEEQMQAVVQGVIDHGKSGKVVLELTVAYDGELQAIKLTPNIKATIPKAKKRAALFFPTEGGGLSRTNPRQREMFDEQEQPGRVYPTRR